MVHHIEVLEMNEQESNKLHKRSSKPSEKKFLAGFSGDRY
jgi:hypothetical protein